MVISMRRSGSTVSLPAYPGRAKVLVEIWPARREFGRVKPRTSPGPLGLPPVGSPMSRIWPEDLRKTALSMPLEKVWRPMKAALRRGWSLPAKVSS